MSGREHHSGFTRRRFLRSAALAAGVAAAGGLSAPASGAGPHNYPLLRVALNTEPPGLDIMWQTADITQDVMHHVFEYLFTQNARLEFKPMLAQRMDVSPDGKTFTIRLRQGVRFHNGKELSADDVIASMNRWIRLVGKAAAVMQERESIAAADRYTVVVKFKQPNGAFLAFISIHNDLLAIMPKEIVEKYAAPDPRGREISNYADLIGTGPYKIVEWVRDRYIRLVRYERYVARDDPPNYLYGRRTAWAQEVRLIPVRDDQTRLNGLLAGEYDVAYTLNAAQFASVKANPALQALVVKPGNGVVGVFNKSAGNMFNNFKLRNAVNWSIDDAKVMAGAFDDPAFYRLTPALAGREWTFWYNEAGAEYYNKRDLGKAKALAAEAGYKGEKIRWITTRDFDYMYRSALIASEQMKEAGFNVELSVMDWPTLVTQRGKKEAYEIFSTGIGFTGDPTATSAFTPGWPGWYDDPDNNANYHALLTTVDPARRKKLFEEQQRLFWAKNPYLRFGEYFTFRAARREVRGLIDVDRPFFWNVWIER